MFEKEEEIIYIYIYIYIRLHARNGNGTTQLCRVKVEGIGKTTLSIVSFAASTTSTEFSVLH